MIQFSDILQMIKPGLGSSYTQAGMDLTGCMCSEVFLPGSHLRILVSL